MSASQEADDNREHALPTRLMMMIGDKDLEYLKSLETGIAALLGVEPAAGIRTSEQAERLERFGENRIPQKPLKTYLAFLWDVFQDLTIYFLVGAAVVSIVLWAALEDHEEEPHGWIEGVAITITVLLVLNLGAWQDWKKQREFNKLNAEVANVKVSVLRDGKPVEISKYDLVVGDVVRLHVGDILEGDGVLLHGSDVECDESALTGEPLLIKKNPGAPFFISGASVQKGQGTYIIVAVGVKSQSGKIQALVRGVAAKEEGEGEKSGPEEEAAGSPLQGKLEKVAILIGKVAAVLAILAFIGMAARFSIKTYAIDGKPWDKSHGKEILGWVTTTIAVFVVAIPEGLPLAVTLALSLSISKMLNLNNMVKHLDSTETMGSTTTICSDKTGTLTQNRMTVVRAQVAANAVKAEDNETCGQRLKKACNDPVLLELLANNICLNRAEAEIEWDDKANRWTQLGNKTDCALLACAHDLGFSYREVRAKDEFFTTQQNDGQRVLGAKLYPFSSSRKRAGIIVPNGDGYRLYVKGAPEMVFALCSESYGGEDFNKEQALQLTSSYAKDALRNIAFAYRDFPSLPPWDIMLSEKDAIRLTGQSAETYQIESNLTFYALVGIEDPVRPSVPPAIRKCNTAGVDVRMVTGDNLETAIAIAKQCGIIRPGIDIVDDKLKHKYMAMTGPDFRKAVLDENGTLNQDSFDLIWPHLRVLARSSPTDKHTLVTGISCSMLYSTDIGRQLNIYPDKQVVAVTGDGTNDAPALKRADVGFAMGITGTSVAKDAADIILLDDDFASIVTACLWGRNVYDSIAKFLQFQLTVNVSAVTLVCVGAFAFSRSPLSIVQMLWVNVIMDSLGALSLASEPPDDKLLLRPPYGRNASVLSSYMIANILGQSAYQLTIVFLILFVGAGDSSVDLPFASRTVGGIFDLKSANSMPPTDHPISLHYSFIFNTFVLMQFGNWINARKLYHEWNVFCGIQRNWMFLGIWFICMLLQVILIEIAALLSNDREDCTNHAVKVVCLTPKLWGWSLAFGAGSFLWQMVIIAVYKLVFPKSRPTDVVITKSYTITAAAAMDDDGGAGSGNLRGILSEQSMMSVLSNGLSGVRNPRRQHDFEAMTSARRSRVTLTPSPTMEV